MLRGLCRWALGKHAFKKARAHGSLCQQGWTNRPQRGGARDWVQVQQGEGGVQSLRVPHSRQGLQCRKAHIISCVIECIAHDVTRAIVLQGRKLLDDEQANRRIFIARSQQQQLVQPSRDDRSHSSLTLDRAGTGQLCTQVCLGLRISVARKAGQQMGAYRRRRCGENHSHACH